MEDGNEGLFAARDIPANITFVLYGGYILNLEQYQIWFEKLGKKKRENGWKEDDPRLYKEFENHMEINILGDR